MKRVLSALLGLVPFAAPAAAQQCPPEPSRYHVGVPQNNHVRVSASLTLGSNRLLVANYKSRDGVATADFIIDPIVMQAGEPNALDHRGDGLWFVPGAGPGDRVEVSYRLRMDHGRHVWPYGVKEIGRTFEGGAFFVGRVVLLADYTVRHCPIDITFASPMSAAPWRPTGKNRYQAETLSQLHNNAFAFGSTLSILKAETSKGAMTFVHDEASAALARDAAQSTEAVLRHFVGLTGSFPRSNYHFFLLNSQSADGGGYEDSFVMMHPVPPRSIDALIWRHGFTHEALNLWIGRAVQPAPGEDLAWFREGFTDYLAVKTLWQLGYIDVAVLEKKVENFARRYSIGQSMSPDTTLLKAGERKGRNRMLINGGGAMLAMILDAHMAKTKGRDAFEAMMIRLYENAGEPYTSARLIAVMDAASGGEASRLIAKFDAGIAPSDLPDMLEPLDISMAVMPPDMFQVALKKERCRWGPCLPPFLQK